MFSLTFSNLITSIYNRGSQIASHTGDTNETTLLSVLVPPAPGPNAKLIVTGIGTVTGSANAKTLRSKYGGTTFTTSVISNAAFVTAFIGNVSGGVLFQNRNSLNSQISASQSSTVAPITAAIDTSVSQTLEITGQLANAGETITLESLNAYWQLY